MGEKLFSRYLSSQIVPVHFPITEKLMSRVQLAINVDNLDEAILFYSKLFATKPVKPGRGMRIFQSQIHHLSWFCLRIQAMEEALITWELRWNAPKRC